MSGGGRLVVINTRERLISSDHNRHQAFAALERAELLRYQNSLRQTPLGQDLAFFMEVGGYVDTTAAGTAAVASPSVADVYDGLTVIPQPGSLNLVVQPGIIGIVDPDGQAGSSDPTPPSTDDSRYKVVVDPGVQALGALVITAGAGSTRVDLVEVRRTTLVLEVDSRDVFDPSTGVFVPVTVNKVVEGRLVYRVRAGTPGAGVPALAQGWTPLCVAVVPSSATTCDGMTFYDVRPLVKDRVNAPFESRHVDSRLEARLWANDSTDPAKTILSGYASSQIGMYRCGGLMPAGPSAIDVRAAANHASGYSPSAGFPWFLYAVFPASLPRWVKYLPFPAARIPVGPLGVLAVSEAGPADQTGVNDSKNPPAASGLVAAGPAVLLASGVVGAGPVEQGFVCTEGLTLVNPNFAIVLPAPGATSTVDTYTASANAHFPDGARSLVVRISATFAGTPGAFDVVHMSVTVQRSTGTDRIARPFDMTIPIIYGPGGSDGVAFSCEVPMLPFGVFNGEPDDRLVFSVNWSTTATRSAQAASVLGWRL